jgi:hypothetical protein
MKKVEDTCEYCGAPIVLEKMPDGTTERQCMDRCMESELDQ